MQLYKKSYLFYLLIILCSLSMSNSRVAYTRPGSVIRTPGTIQPELFNQYIVGFSTELINLSDLNYAATTYFQGITQEGYQYGLSYTTPASSSLATINSNPPSQLGFHIQKEIFTRNQIGVIIGVHDIFYDIPEDHRLSLFACFSHDYKINNQFYLETTLGFGTGFISHDSHDYQDPNNLEGANFFSGFKLHTPYRLEYGGIKILMEYDGWGINIGATIPLSDAWTINTGFTHFENIAKFNDWDAAGRIFDDAPAIVFGFQMNIPKLSYPKTNNTITNWSNGYNFINSDEALDSLLLHANTIINALEDSLMLINNEQESLENLNTSLNYKINTLIDSLNSQELSTKIDVHNLNKTMKLLSNSLDAYYAEKYSVALDLTTQAIELMPNLAISYARKGSIYYKIGDVKRATINWNYALNLDPEYHEVRNVLEAIKNNTNTLLLPK